MPPYFTAELGRFFSTYGQHMCFPGNQTENHEDLCRCGLRNGRHRRMHASLELLDPFPLSTSHFHPLLRCPCSLFVLSTYFLRHCCLPPAHLQRMGFAGRGVGQPPRRLFSRCTGCAMHGAHLAPQVNRRWKRLTAQSLRCMYVASAPTCVVIGE